MTPGHILRIFLSAQMGTGGLVDDCFLKMPWQQFDWNPFNIPLRLPAACKDSFELFYTLADSLKVLLFCFPLTCNEWPQCGNCSPFKWKWQEKKSLGQLFKWKEASGQNFNFMANLPLTHFNFLDSNDSVKCDWQEGNSAEELTPPATCLSSKEDDNKKASPGTFGNVGE